MKINLIFVLRKKSVSRFFAHLCTWFNFFCHCEVLFPRHCEERSDAAIHKNSSNKHTNPGLPHSRWSFAMTPAFSLVELLMALLVASLLMAALAPVMTKRAEVVSFDEKVNAPQNTQAVYANPGSYGFEVPQDVKSVQIQAAGGGGGGAGALSKTYKVDYTSSQTFTVPKGVYEMSFTLIGGGGAGGSGYASNGTDKCGSGINTLELMADNGRDLCLKQVNPFTTYTWKVADKSLGETCSGERCCWKNLGHPCSDSPKGGATGCGRVACKYSAATSWCSNATYNGLGGNAGRLLTKTEAQRIIDGGNYGAGSLELGYYDNISMGLDKYYGSTLPIVGIMSQVSGTDNNYAYPNTIWLQDKYSVNAWNAYPPAIGGPGNANNAYAVHCVRERLNWNPYSAAGGASGSKYTHKIRVNPGDTLELKVGEGGKGASAGTRGKTGGTTYLYHTDKKTGTKTTYFANGGAGGNPATGDSHAAVTSQTPSCSSNGGSCSFAISSNAGIGTSGSYANAGNGAGGALGGTPDSAKGAGAVPADNGYGAGGGGGACSRNVRAASGCSSGGAGANGKIEITYSAVTPGGGGGAGGAVGYNGETNTIKILTLGVTPGEILSVTIGAGGAGGGANTNGYDGKDTIISLKNGKKYAFKGGKGGMTGQFSTSNLQMGGEGGLGGNFPNASLKDYAEMTAPLTTKGLAGALDDAGFAGGTGGKTVNGFIGGCGGMAKSAEGETADGACNSGTETGDDAVSYNASINKYGGEGGGGGGFNPDSKAFGAGGSGADGFVLIKWELKTSAY